jgi:hypothetical protein
MVRQKKKLRIDRSTVRNLSHPDLHMARGGVSRTVCGGGGPSGCSLENSGCATNDTLISGCCQTTDCVEGGGR